VSAGGNAGFLINALTQVLSVRHLWALSYIAVVGRKDRADCQFWYFNQSLGLVSAVRGIYVDCWESFHSRPRQLQCVGLAADDATSKAGTTYSCFGLCRRSRCSSRLLVHWRPPCAAPASLRPTMIVQAASPWTINILLHPVLNARAGGTAVLWALPGRPASRVPLRSLIGVADWLWVYFPQVGNVYVAVNRETVASANYAMERILNIRPAGRRRVCDHVRLYMAVHIYYLRLEIIWRAPLSGLRWHRLRGAGLIQAPAIAIAICGRSNRRPGLRRSEQRAAVKEHLQESRAQSHWRRWSHD